MSDSPHSAHTYPTQITQEGEGQRSNPYSLDLHLPQGQYAQTNVQGYDDEQRQNTQELLEATIRMQQEAQNRPEHDGPHYDLLQKHAADMERQRTALVEDWQRVRSGDFINILEERTANYRAQIDSLTDRINSLQVLAQGNSTQTARMSPTLTNQLQTAINHLSQQSETQSLSHERLLDRIETLTQVSRTEAERPAPTSTPTANSDILEALESPHNSHTTTEFALCRNSSDPAATTNISKCNSNRTTDVKQDIIPVGR